MTVKLFISIVLILLFGCQTPKKTIEEVNKWGEEQNLQPITFSGIYYDLQQHTSFPQATFNSFTVSYDETIIVFSAKIDTPYFQLYIKKPKSKIFTQLVHSNSNDTHPSLSPDLKKVVFISDKDGFSNIYIVEIDKPFLIEQLTDDKDEKFLPCFSPDGNIILYTVKENNRFSLVTLDMTTKTKTYLGEGIGFGWIAPNKIIFMKSNLQSLDQVWTLDVDTLSISQIIFDFGKKILYPYADPTGTKFSYSTIKGEFDIVAMLKQTLKFPSQLKLTVLVNGNKADYQIINDGYIYFNPIVTKERIYFISDRKGSENLWSLKVAFETNKQ
jgi:hypothetical protein